MAISTTFRCVKEISFRSGIEDDNENVIFTAELSGEYYHESGDYWNPPYTEYSVDKAVFAEPVKIDGILYEAGTPISDNFMKKYAEDPNYFDSFDDLSDDDIEDYEAEPEFEDF